MTSKIVSWTRCINLHVTEVEWYQSHLHTASTDSFMALNKTSNTPCSHHNYSLTTLSWWNEMLTLKTNDVFTLEQDWSDTVFILSAADGQTPLKRDSKKLILNSDASVLSYCSHTTIAPIYSLVQHTERTHQVRTWNLASRESKLLFPFFGVIRYEAILCSHPCVICCVYLFCAIFVPLNGHLWLQALAISVFLLLCLFIHVCLLLLWYSADGDFLDLAYGICALSIVLYTGFIPTGTTMLKREATLPLSFVTASEHDILHWFFKITLINF